MKKVSLIMTTYNCRDQFHTTMKSVLRQDYPNLEIVVVDGASTDGTRELLEQYGGKLGRKLVWVSEKDGGIYDAMNKGYRLSSGEIIVFFNDLFLLNTAVSDMVSAIEQAGEQCLGAHADLIYADGKKVVRYWKMGRGRFSQGWMPGHPTLYVKRQVYEEYGLYDTGYRCSADYEFMVRAFCGREDRLAYVPKTMVRMYYGGTSTGGAAGYWISLKEGHRALRKNKVRRAFWIDLRRTFRVIGQFAAAKRYQA